jgi:hypothetical protein
MGHPSVVARRARINARETAMHRIIIANRRGHQVIEWEDTDTDEARMQIAAAERILREARSKGCAVSRKVGAQHVLDNAPFDPKVEEYQIIAPIAGG